MSRIVAMSCSEIRDNETMEINQEIIKLSGKKRPKVLFIPTLTSDVDLNDFSDDIKSYFGKALDCRINVLKLSPRWLNGAFLIQDEIIEEINAILHSDIVYIGGNDAYNILKLWRRLNIGKVVRKAFNRETIMCALNVGGIYWFKLGDPDPKCLHKASTGSFRIEKSDFLKQILAPHFNMVFSEDKSPSITKVIERTSGAAIALADSCAIAFDNGQYRVFSHNPIYKICWNKGKIEYKEIWQDDKWQKSGKLFKNNYSPVLQ